MIFTALTTPSSANRSLESEAATGRCPKRSHIDWPLFEPRHRRDGFRSGDLGRSEHHSEHHGHDIDRACRDPLVRKLGDAGWLKYAIGGFRHTAGLDEVIDTQSRSALFRETLAGHSGLADFAFAMQGLGSGAVLAVWRSGTEAAILDSSS